MALTFKLYTDSGLTTELSGNIVIEQNQDGSTGDIDGVLYLGSTASGKTLQADSDPGVDQITVSIADSTPSAGNGPETTDLKLATTNGGLTAATAGDPLDLGTSISSGVGNQVEIHYRQITPTSAATGTFTEITLNTNTVRET